MWPEMSAAATRDDLASVHKALSDQAAVQRKWQAEYEARAAAARDVYERAVWERAGAMARGTASAFEVSADMISKYVAVEGK